MASIRDLCNPVEEDDQQQISARDHRSMDVDNKAAPDWDQAGGGQQNHYYPSEPQTMPTSSRHYRTGSGSGTESHSTSTPPLAPLRPYHGPPAAHHHYSQQQQQQPHHHHQLSHHQHHNGHHNGQHGQHFYQPYPSPHGSHQHSHQQPHPHYPAQYSTQGHAPANPSDFQRSTPPPPPSHHQQYPPPSAGGSPGEYGYHASSHAHYDRPSYDQPPLLQQQHHHHHHHHPPQDPHGNYAHPRGSFGDEPMPPAAASGHPGSQHAGYPSYPPSRHGHEGEEEQRARRYAPPSNGPDAPSENHGTSQQLPSTNADAGTVQSRPIVSSGSRASMDEHRPVKIKIAQQPLHARMCGFGEKDRRPVDPPPIVQLIFEDEETADGTSPNPASHNGQQKSKEDHPQNEPIKTEGEAMEIKATTQQSSGEGDEHASKESEHAEDHRDDHDHDDDGHDDDDHAYDHSPAGAVGGADAKAPGQDHLYVLHVSLWSQDGSEVRNMIATPTAGSAGISSAGDGSNSGSGGVSGGGGGGGGVVMEPPKLTRILMGSLVISPVLLNNAEGKPGWYFSFPDLSIRTEGVYTLKFSLMRFGSENGHASTLVTEVVSNPFTVYSAKKFPGMTESTELSKAFAKQGLKIPIRNDLRVKKADRD